MVKIIGDAGVKVSLESSTDIEKAVPILELFFSRKSDPKRSVAYLHAYGDGRAEAGRIVEPEREAARQPVGVLHHPLEHVG